MYHIDSSVKSHQKESTPNVQVAALAELLQDDEIELICRQLGHTWRNRIFTPAVTVRSMVHRALNPDKSIRSTLVALVLRSDTRFWAKKRATIGTEELRVLFQPGDVSRIQRTSSSANSPVQIAILASLEALQKSSHPSGYRNARRSFNLMALG